MITAKNYAAQAETELRNYLKAIEQTLGKEDSNRVLELCSEIKESVHFAVPDGGRVLYDRGRGIFNQQLRLPFPSITIEYFCEKDAKKLKTNRVHVYKRVLHLSEIISDKDGLVRSFFYSKEEIDKYSFIRNSEAFIVLRVICFSERDRVWTPMPMAAILPSDWSNPEIGKDYCMGKTIPFMCSFLETISKQGITAEDLAHDVIDEYLVLLEFLSALSCKNVEIGTFQEKSTSNEKRLKKGKTPFYETKCLVLSTSKESAGKTGQQGSHASPRQHLRRGHIRRLESGNIWVNSCVVGSAENGVIDKTYAVMK